MSNLVLLVGAFSTGKSTTFHSLMQKIEGKCLILDPGSAEPYKSYPEIAPEHAWKFTGQNGQGRIYRVQDGGDPAREISLVFGYNPETHIYSKSRAYLNGNLFLEDAGAYLDSNLSRAARKQIKGIKQHGLNMYLSYHSIDEISKEVLRMKPTVIMLKKTGDGHVFSRITKAKDLDNYNQVLQAFYKCKFRGLDKKDIVDQLPAEDLFSVARDLRIDHGVKGNPKRDIIKYQFCLKIGDLISHWANGTKRITKAMKEAGKYHTETVLLR